MKLSNGLALNGHPSGRHFLQIPGPTNVPDRILRAMDYPTIDHRGPEFQQLGKSVLSGIRKIFKTESHVVIYPGSGTGAWEAALVNTLSPGDTVLMSETGHFASLWKRMADRLGLVVEFIPGDWRSGVDAALVHPRLGRPDLLVTVDNGIASIEGVARARSAGLQVLVTDHHLPGS